MELESNQLLFYIKTNFIIVKSASFSNWEMKTTWIWVKSASFSNLEMKTNWIVIKSASLWLIDTDRIFGLHGVRPNSRQSTNCRLRWRQPRQLLCHCASICCPLQPFNSIQNSMNYYPIIHTLWIFDFWLWIYFRFDFRCVVAAVVHSAGHFLLFRVGVLLFRTSGYAIWPVLTFIFLF